MAGKINLMVLLTLLALLTGCQEDPCDENMELPAGVQFKTLNNDGNVNDTTLASLTVFTPALPDTLLYDSVQNESSIAIPLSSEADISTFILVTDSVRDTLTFYYQREFNLVSQDCGFRAIFMLDSIKTSYHQIDSLNLINTTINTSDATHLEIFFF